MRKQSIPTFASEDEERAFWADHDATDFLEFSDAKQALLPNLRPTLKRVTLRLPVSLIEFIKVIAHKRNVPYQSLMKFLLKEGIERELHSITGKEKSRN